MSVSRRRFLEAGMLATLFAAVPLKNALGQTWKDRDGNPVDSSTSGVQNDPLANYTKATFISYLNSVFQLRIGFGVAAVTLLRVDDMAAAKGGECFSLLFRGGGGRALPQDTYTVEHAALGTFKLFLVPVGADDNGAQGYLATMNRLSHKDALAPAPVGSSTAKRSGSIKPATPTQGPANASPTTTPVKPAKREKPSWKRNEEDFEGGIDQ